MPSLNTGHAQMRMFRVEAEGYEPVELGITPRLVTDGKTLNAPNTDEAQNDGPVRLATSPGGA